MLRLRVRNVVHLIEALFVGSLELGQEPHMIEHVTRRQLHRAVCRSTEVSTDREDAVLLASFSNLTDGATDPAQHLDQTIFVPVTVLEQSLHTTAEDLVLEPTEAIPDVTLALSTDDRCA